MFSESRLWECRVFPGKGSGPGFSFSCRPSALTAPWIWGRGGFFCMHFYRVFWIWGDFCMHFYRVCWIPLMGMSCFLVQNCTHFTKVSCFSVHVCSHLSAISCFVCFFACFCTSVCDSVLMCCSLWQAVPESSWYFNAFLRCFLGAVYGNVVCFRWNVDAHHKSVVFLRWALSPAIKSSSKDVKKTTTLLHKSCAHT